MGNTQNESVLDTYLDLAVYSVILYAIVLEQAQLNNQQNYQTITT
jgi:hypothetical protein